MKLAYHIREVRPYINWIYFFHAWGMNGKPKDQQARLQDDANSVLDRWETRLHPCRV